MDRNNPKIIRGGIGDIILRLGRVKPDEYYELWSHYLDAGDLLMPFTSNFIFKHMVNVPCFPPNQVEAEVYPKFDIPKGSIAKARAALDPAKRYVAVHPIGSSISRYIDINRRVPQKLMTKSFVERIVAALSDHNTECLLFLAPDEKRFYEGINVRFITEPYIWDTFAYISCCKLMVAVESSLKTMSAVLHIPTVVLLGNFYDQFRSTHITPYEGKEIFPIIFDKIDEKAEETVALARKLLG